MTKPQRWLPIGIILFVCTGVSLVCPVQAAAPAIRLFDARLVVHPEISLFDSIVHDMNGDGIPDLVAFSADLEYPELNSVSVVQGIGDGTFHQAVISQVAEFPRSIAAGDLNRDGVADLVVRYEYNTFISILLGNGDGSFEEAVDVEAGEDVRSVVIGDLNEDHAPDLALVAFNPNRLSIFPGNGDGTFQDAAILPIENYPQHVVSGDFDEDGHLDLVLSRMPTDTLLLLRGYGDGSFHEPEPIGEGTDHDEMAVHDLNNDGHSDLAVTDYLSDAVSVLIGNGDGTFQPAVTCEIGEATSGIAAGDLDGDGIADLAVSSGGDYLDTNIWVLLAAGDGTYHEPVRYDASFSVQSIDVADVDGDDSLDLVFPSTGNRCIGILLGRGNGIFPAPARFTAGDGPHSAVLGDLDGDRRLDLAVSNAVSDDVSVLPGRGDGTFGEGTNYVVGDELPGSIALGYLNGDDHPDLVVVLPFRDKVSILLGNGGGFQGPTLYVTGEKPLSLSVADLDWDGNTDLVTANRDSDDVSVLLGNGDGTFLPAVSYPAGEGPVAVAIGDLDGDGIRDLAVADYRGDALAMLSGHGDGTFQNWVNIEIAGWDPIALAISDLDQDGALDLAVGLTTVEGGCVQVLLGNGDGTFQKPMSYGTAGSAGDITVADLDGDGHLDLSSVNLDGILSVLLGTGDGSFRPAVSFGAGKRLAAGDINEDGWPDLVGPDVIVLINNTNPSLIITGPGPAYGNGPLVRLFPLVQGALPLAQFQAYGSLHYGVKVGSGDPDGDGFDEIITGAGPGEIFGPHVRGFEKDGRQMVGLSFLAYGTNKFGVNVAAGDLDGDGDDEIVTGAGPGPVFGPHVRAFDYDGSPGVVPVPGVSYFAYGTPKWGVNVAAGDIDGDGFDEIVTGAGPGAVYGPHVRGWNVDGGAAAAIPGISYFAYGTLKYGVNVSCGDLDGDGIDEIVTGAGPGVVFGPHVRGWDYDGSTVTPLPGYSFFAWSTEPLSCGVNVFSGVDLNGDGRDELLAGRGPDPAADTEVKVFTWDGTAVNEWISILPYPQMAGGGHVAAGQF